ncbi:mavicyanin [Cryptomeria japonica]|uniref:mavicyanin n=1 Tax=Cryptomeria japonica TaxID=3369 RepID=UPI0027DA6201|nr:mavicyanin [Cryptomeria japonica]
MESESLQGKGRCGNWKLILIFTVAIFNSRGCKAAEHVVGADRGWDPQSAHNFQEWASSKIFRVGDNLWFAYSSAVQSVAEVNSREEWETCDVSNPIRLYKGGLDSVPLHSEGSRYFVSGRAEDCLKNGMKLHINVVPFNTSSPVNVKAVAEAPKSSGMSVFTAFSFFCACVCIFLSLSLSFSL